MNITKKKQTHKYRKQTSGYWWGEGSWEGQDRGRGFRRKNYYVKSKVQECSVQQREYTQYFIITINEVSSLKTVTHYVETNRRL